MHWFRCTNAYTYILNLCRIYQTVLPLAPTDELISSLGCIKVLQCCAIFLLNTHTTTALKLKLEKYYLINMVGVIRVA